MSLHVQIMARYLNKVFIGKSGPIDEDGEFGTDPADLEYYF